MQFASIFNKDLSSVTWKGQRSFREAETCPEYGMEWMGGIQILFWLLAEE